MDIRGLLMSVFTLALLAPVMYRRYQRRTGAAPASLGSRKGKIAVAVMASLVFSGVIGGAAFASNGDKSGAKTGTEISNLVPTDKAQDQNNTPTLGDVTSQTEKNRVSINMDWLMLGGILVLFMQ